MTAPIRNGMIEQLRLARRSRYHITSWRLTELQAWQLADEIRWVQREFNVSPSYLCEIVESMKAGNIRVLGAKVVVQ